MRTTRGFNSRTREGATIVIRVMRIPNSVSIHAPVRVRLLRIGYLMTILSFNSRTREGATKSVLSLLKCNLVSIHAPVRVRHEESVNALRLVAVSIHAPVRVRLQYILN